MIRVSASTIARATEFSLFLILFTIAPAFSQSCSYAASSPSSTSSKSGLLRIYAYGVANATSMTFPTWGQGVQDDLIWYPGYNLGGGTWYADINLANHKSNNPEYGTFDTHVTSAFYKPDFADRSHRYPRLASRGTSGQHYCAGLG